MYPMCAYIFIQIAIHDFLYISGLMFGDKKRGKLLRKSLNEKYKSVLQKKEQKERRKRLSFFFVFNTSSCHPHSTIQQNLNYSPLFQFLYTNFISRFQLFFQFFKDINFNPHLYIDINLIYIIRIYISYSNQIKIYI